MGYPLRYSGWAFRDASEASEYVAQRIKMGEETRQDHMRIIGEYDTTAFPEG